jgi:hypothetical protein
LAGFDFFKKKTWRVLIFSKKENLAEKNLAGFDFFKKMKKIPLTTHSFIVTFFTPRPSLFFYSAANKQQINQKYIHRTTPHYTTLHPTTPYLQYVYFHTTQCIRGV